MNADEQLKKIRTADGRFFYEIQLKRARITAVVLAFATCASLIFLVFAFVQREKASELEAELRTAKQALEICQNAK